MVCILSENTGNPLKYRTLSQSGKGGLMDVTVTAEPAKPQDVLPSLGKENFDKIFEAEKLENHAECQWVGVKAVMKSKEPCCWVLSYEDFSTLEQYDSRNVELGVAGNFQYKTAEFSLNDGNKVCDDCKMVLLIEQKNNGDEKTVEMVLHVFYFIPKGYEEAVLGFHNFTALSKEQLEKGMSDPGASLGFIERTEGDLYIRIK